MSRSNLVLWAIDALKKGEKIKVVNDQFRSPTLAEDLAEACFLAAQKKAHGIYHISGKGVHSILELVKIVAKTWNLNASLIEPISSDTLNQPAKRPPKTGFVLEKAEKDLGYIPKTFEQGLDFLKTQLTVQLNP
jgi:dTDP-4-dehydrorhamnose reductase